MAPAGSLEGGNGRRGASGCMSASRQTVRPARALAALFLVIIYLTYPTIECKNGF